MPEHVPIPANLDELRHLIKGQAIRSWHLAQRCGLSESLISKVLNERTRLPDDFLERAHTAIVEILDERRRALSTGAKR